MREKFCIIMLTRNVNKIISHVDIIMLHVDIKILYVVMNMSHVDRIKLHVDVIYFAFMGQKYVTIRYIQECNRRCTIYR